MKNLGERFGTRPARNPAALTLFIAGGLSLAWLEPALAIDVPCNAANGPDVIVAEITGVKSWGEANGLSGYTLGTNACNIGSAPLKWIANTNEHPVIAMNVYRLRKNKFEQIGMSWVKHGFYAEVGSYCCQCQSPPDSNLLGVGCSDVYSAELNGHQSGFNNIAGLGPRSEVNPFTGEYAFPYGSQGLGGDAIYKRIQIANEDLDPALNGGAQYFAEVQYIAADDAAAGNALNNVSYAPLAVGPKVNGAWTLSLAGPTVDRKPAIHAWAAADPGVTLTTINVPGDGRMIMASRVSPKGGNVWRYEYAVYNMTSHRAAWKFVVPVPSGVGVSNIRFNDIHHHSGEPYSGDDWDIQSKLGKIVWRTQKFDDAPNANALRWGTMYNFRFNANTPPRTISGKLALFRPGALGKVSGSIKAPSPPGSSGGGAGGGGLLSVQSAGGDASSDNISMYADIVAVLSAWGACDNERDCPADIAPDDGDGKVDLEDLLEVLRSPEE